MQTLLCKCDREFQTSANAVTVNRKFGCDYARLLHPDRSDVKLGSEGIPTVPDRKDNNL